MGKDLKIQMVRPEYLTVRGAASYLSMCERTIRSLLTDPIDPLPHFRKGRMIRLQRSEIDEWMEQYRTCEHVDIDGIVNDLI